MRPTAPHAYRPARVRSRRACKCRTWTWVALLLAKRVQPKKMLKISMSGICPVLRWHLCWYMSRNHYRRTYGPPHWPVSAMATSGETISNSTNNSTASSLYKGWMSWNAPTIGIWRRDTTSSSVIETSPTGRWKLEVSRCHLSKKEDISPWSSVSIKHTIKGLNPVRATMSSIAGTGLPKLCTFLPWEDNFNSGHCWIEVQRNTQFVQITSISNQKLNKKEYLIDLNIINTYPDHTMAASWSAYSVSTVGPWVHQEIPQAHLQHPVHRYPMC